MERVRPSAWTFLDLVLGASIALLGVTIVFRQGSTRPIAAVVRSAAARVQWHAAYETGLLLGLAAAGLVLAVGLVITLVVIARRRA